MRINKSPKRIKRDAGGRKKNPMAKLVRSPLYKPKVKPSGKTYRRKKNPVAKILGTPKVKPKIKLEVKPNPTKLYIKFSRKRRTTIK